MKKRTRKPRRDISIQPRDRAILQALKNFRFLTNTHIRAFVDPTWEISSLNKRLRLLYEHRYIDRPDAQRLIERVGGGGYPAVYSLDTEGAKELADYTGVPAVKVDYRQNNREVGQLRIKHQLIMVDAMMRIKAGCDRYGYELIDESDFIRRYATDKHKTLMKGRRTSRGWLLPPENKHFIPDRMFRIRNPRLPQGRDTYTYFIEADTGSETHRIVAQKMERYFQTSRGKILQDHYRGVQGFRTIFVTEKPLRMHNLVATCNKITFGNREGWPGLLFGNLEDMSDDLLSSSLIASGTGENLVLAEEIK